MRTNEAFSESDAPDSILEQIQRNDDAQLDGVCLYAQSALHNLQAATLRMLDEIVAMRKGLVSVGVVPDVAPPDVPNGCFGIDNRWEGLDAAMASVMRDMTKVNSLLYIRRHRTWVRALLRGDTPYVPIDKEEGES